MASPQFCFVPKQRSSSSLRGVFAEMLACTDWNDGEVVLDDAFFDDVFSDDTFLMEEPEPESPTDTVSEEIQDKTEGEDICSQELFLIECTNPKYLLYKVCICPW